MEYPSYQLPAYIIPVANAATALTNPPYAAAPYPVMVPNMVPNMVPTMVPTMVPNVVPNMVALALRAYL